MIDRESLVKLDLSALHDIVLGDVRKNAIWAIDERRHQLLMGYKVTDEPLVDRNRYQLVATQFTREDLSNCNTPAARWNAEITVFDSGEYTVLATEKNYHSNLLYAVDILDFFALIIASDVKDNHHQHRQYIQKRDIKEAARNEARKDLEKLIGPPKKLQEVDTLFKNIHT